MKNDQLYLGLAPVFFKLSVGTLPGLMQIAILVLVGAIGGTPILKSLFSKATRGIDKASASNLAITAVCVLLVIAAWAFIANRQFDGGWDDPPSIGVSRSDIPEELQPDKALGTSKYDYDVASTRFSPDCVLARTSGSSWPWLSGRNRGLPQMLRVEFNRPVMVTSIQVIPGWLGDETDYQRPEKPRYVQLIAGRGFVQNIDLTQFTYASAKAANARPEPVPLRHPVITGGVNLRVLEGLENRPSTSIARVRVWGYRLSNLQYTPTLRFRGLQVFGKCP